MADNTFSIENFNIIANNKRIRTKDILLKAKYIETDDPVETSANDPKDYFLEVLFDSIQEMEEFTANKTDDEKIEIFINKVKTAIFELGELLTHEIGVLLTVGSDSFRVYPGTKDEIPFSHREEKLFVGNVFIHNHINDLPFRSLQTARMINCNTMNAETKLELFAFGLIDEKKLDNAIIPDDEALKHSTIGTEKDWQPPSVDYPAGRLKAGGHSQAGIEELIRRSVPFTIIGTHANGVRYGNIPSSKNRLKREEGKMTWFPANWTEADIKASGIYVATKQKIAPNKQREFIAKFKEVWVSVFIDDANRIGTICPNYNQEREE